MPDDVLTGKIQIADYTGDKIMILNAATGQVSIGGGSPAVGKIGVPGHPGGISVNDINGSPRIEIQSDGPFVSLFDALSATPRILLNAGNKDIVITTPIKGHPDSEVIRLDGDTGNVGVGGNGVNAQLALFPAGVQALKPVEDLTKATIHLRALDATMRAGGNGIPGRVLILDAKGAAKITIEGSSGDIILANADCAEDFDVARAGDFGPGTVVVLDAEGKLRESDQPYDRKVAGVISGAGGYKPGIVLDKQASSGDRAPVALVGKVYCKVDASESPIEVGDLLTTSAIPGHAMKAEDPRKAFGAVIGKALRSLSCGQGLIPVLVALQ